MSTSPSRRYWTSSSRHRRDPPATVAMGGHLCHRRFSAVGGLGVPSSFHRRFDSCPLRPTSATAPSPRLRPHPGRSHRRPRGRRRVFRKRQSVAGRSQATFTTARGTARLPERAVRRMLERARIAASARIRSRPRAEQRSGPAPDARGGVGDSPAGLPRRCAVQRRRGKSARGSVEARGRHADWVACWTSRCMESRLRPSSFER